MRRKPGFTLIEMLVSVALVLFIMVILTEAFGKGLESFRTLKAIGDMEARLRTAASVLRRDLTADHFEGKRRLSDPNTRWTAMGVPREGFFVIGQNGAGTLVNEGIDSDGIGFRRQLDVLYFTVKLRGNDRSQFFTATLDKGAKPSPLLNPQTQTVFFKADQPSDARFQDTPNTYSSQWAEVLFTPLPNGATLPDGSPLYTLYRSQLLIVADNSRLNWPPFDRGFPVPYTTTPGGTRDQHKEMSWRVQGQPPNQTIYFNNPSDLTARANRTLLPNSGRLLTPENWPLTPLLTDVLSFDVDYIRGPNEDLNNPDNRNLDIDTASRDDPIFAIRARIRVWDQKTRQTRQITLVQDM